MFAFAVSLFVRRRGPIRGVRLRRRFLGRRRALVVAWWPDQGHEACVNAAL